MGAFIINVENTSGNIGTIIPDVSFYYTEYLNNINEAEIRISGTGTVMRGLFEIGSKVEIKRDGTREFYGIIDELTTLDAGTIVASISGYEIMLAKENGAYANSPWKATASATINANIIGDSSYFTAGTVEAGTNIDYRLNTGESIWTGLSNLARKTTQDIGIDYVNDEIDVLDHKGSSTSVLTFNDGVEITNFRVTKSYPKGNIIRVYGKGDGDLQIKADANDAASIAAYMSVTRDVTDKSIMSTSEAQKLADAELALTKDETKIYDFNVVNPNHSLVAGDKITLVSIDKDVSGEDVRITGMKRGMHGDKEFLQLQTCNPAYKQLILKKNKVLSRIEKQNRDNITYMDGTGNVLTWSRGINAKLNTPLKMPFYVPASVIEDEAGNLRVKTMTLDYDVDPYRKGVGGATDAGHQHSDPIQTSSSYTLTSDQGSDSFTDTSLSIGWNNNQMSESIDAGTYDFLYVYVMLHCDFSSADFDVGIRIHFDGDYNVRYFNMHASTGVGTYPIQQTFLFPVFASKASPVTLYVDVYSSVNQQYDGDLHVYGCPQAHSHSIPQHNVVTNTANVTIGNDMVESGSVNSSQVSLYLDFWNTGTSTWDNKHSILNTGKTLDYDVDITDSGTYPDAVGYWRVRVNPSHGSPDYVQSIVRIRHAMDD